MWFASKAEMTSFEQAELISAYYKTKAKENTQKQAFSHFSFTESYSLKVALFFFFLNKETLLSFNSSVPFESKNEERIYLGLL